MGLTCTLLDAIRERDGDGGGQPSSVVICDLQGEDELEKERGGGREKEKKED